MIKTQLCPAAELEDKKWWIKDATMVLGFVVLGYWTAGFILDLKRNETAELTAKKERWAEEYKVKEPAIEQFKGLKAEMDRLNKKIASIKAITTSRIDKVRGLIALDQLQTLWIEGIWYNYVKLDADGTLRINGSANDSLLVGEFMLGMRESMNHETTNDDLRTQIGFEDVSIKNAVFAEDGDAMFKDIRSCMNFEIYARHKEKKVVSVNMSYVPMGRNPLAVWK
jgi:hypothetical protein